MKRNKKAPNHLLTRKLNEAGIFFGTTTKYFQKHFVGKSANLEGHVTGIGGSGSGKSAGFVIPTIVDTWGDNPFVTIDIKGEIKREYDKRPDRRDSKVFNLSGAEGDFASFDPYYFLYRDGERNLVQNVRELVNAIIPIPLNERDPFWKQSARNLLTAAILYYFDTGLTFIDTVIEITTASIGDLINEISDSGNKKAITFISHFQDSAELAESKMLQGVFQELNNHLSIFSTDACVVEALTPSENQIKWEELGEYNVFMQVPEDRLEQYSGVIALMLTQLVRTLERRPEMHSEEGANLPPILLMFDEFPRLGKLEIISSSISTLRSKRVTICLLMQSLAQLEFIYGREVMRIILENCQYKIIFNAGDAESRRILSELIGTTVVLKPSFGINYDASHQVSGYSQNVTTSREAIIQPHELGKLKDNVVLLTPSGYCIVDKVQYHSETYQKYRSQELKPSLWQKVTNFTQRIKKGLKNAWNKLKNLFKD
jgi:type IV secretion system protein VirD4